MLAATAARHDVVKRAVRHVLASILANVAIALANAVPIQLGCPLGHLSVARLADNSGHTDRTVDCAQKPITIPNGQYRPFVPQNRTGAVIHIDTRSNTAYQVAHRYLDGRFIDCLKIPVNNKNFLCQ